MAELNEIPVVEVEDFTPPSTYDENDVMFDDEGKIESYIDREKNERYVRKAAAPAPAPAPTGGGDPKPDDDPKPGDGDDPKPGEGEDDDEDEEEVIDNAAEYVLRKIGYDKEEINLGGEGEEANLVKIKDLTPEQQMDIVVSEFDRTVEQYEAKIKELESKAPELKFENPLHQQIVDYLKGNGDVMKLAKELLSKDPAAQAKMMSDEEIVKASIKKEFAEFTDEEVNAELKDMSPDKIARRAKALRARAEKEAPSIAHLTEEQKAAQQAEQQRVRQEYETEVKSVKEYLAKTKNIAGIPLNEDLKNFLATRVIPDSPEADSEFMKKLDSPEKLVRLEFLDRYFEQIRQRDQEHFYKKGIADAQKMKAEELAKYSKEPLRTYNIQPKKGGEKKGPRSVDEIENWDDFASKGEF